MNTNETNEKVMDFFKAFSNIDRLKIAGLLAVEALSPGQAASRLGMRDKDTMNHISYLAHFGYLKEVGNAYQLDIDAFNKLSRQVLEGSQPRSKVEDFEGEDFERKVLKDFITADGRLKAIPSQQKKLLIVLRHIVSKFEPGVQYPEKQVNEMLRRYHPDSASLRRYLIDQGLLQRENNIYWRTAE
jgi:hypothetical protein